MRKEKCEYIIRTFFKKVLIEMAISVHIHSERRRKLWWGLNCFSRICYPSFGLEFWVLRVLQQCPFNNKNVSSVLSNQMNGVKG